MNLNTTYYVIYIRTQRMYINANGGMTPDQGAAMLMSKEQAEERVEYLRSPEVDIDAVLGIYRPAWKAATS